MIQPLSATMTAADFKLPSQITATDATIEAFGHIYAANTKQFATRETADALASLLGGTVSDLSEQWGLGRISPLYQIELSAGVSLNAGLLADRFQRYGNAAAMKMTEDELGILLPPITTTPSISQSKSNTESKSVLNADTKSTVVAGGDSVSKASVAQPTSPATASDAEKHKLAEAAKQFESLLMAQILKSATPESEDGLLAGTGDSSSQSLYQLALENFAGVIGQHGGLGLANSVVDQLKLAGPKTSIHG